MKSSVVVAKHPLHPMLITIPIGAFVLALVGDLTFMVSGRPFWYVFATWSIVFGVVGALLAAVPGLLDYLTVVPKKGPEARRQATTHMIINLSVVALFAINLAIRYFAAGPTFWLTTALTVVGDAALMYSGWLGGHLVYHHRIGVEEPGQTETARLRVTMSPEEAERVQHQ